MSATYQLGITPEWKFEIWKHWKTGAGLSDIGRAINKAPASVFEIIRASGGFQPRIQTRSERFMSLEEREEIAISLGQGLSYREIARRLERSASSIMREVKRNGGRIRYRAMKAEKSTWTRAKRPKLLKLERYPQLKRTVQRKLEQKWSPEQIAGWLRQTYTDDEDMRVSHESIYKSLFLQARGGLKRELTRHLRSGRVLRQSRKNNYRGSPRGGGLNLPSISERPAEAEDRAIPGHWEGDLISGSQNTHIATLVERKSRYAMMVKIKGKDTESVVSALIKIVKRLPSELRKTLTWDRGMELKKHIDFTLATDMKVYFCDPQSPWQRGSNENTNRLIRQYLPRKTDLSVHTQAELNKICQELNSRPRKTLGYKTPAEVLSEVLH